MQIQGFMKMTLLDYPGKVACTVFTGGCNFRCPFCHNGDLVLGGGDPFTQQEILEFLQKRQGLLDGVCISGGEPLLQKDIADFMREIKALGYSVKLDTNGSFPTVLKALVAQNLVDYVAMDIKNCPEKYAVTAGADVPPDAVRESIDFLLTDAVDYEFRTTVVRELHTVEDIERIGAWIRGAKRWFLQNFVESGKILQKNLSAHDEKILVTMRNTGAMYVKSCALRGV